MFFVALIALLPRPSVPPIVQASMHVFPFTTKAEENIRAWSRLRELEALYKRTWLFSIVQQRRELCESSLACLLEQQSDDNCELQIVPWCLALAKTLDDQYHHVGNAIDYDNQITLLELALHLLPPGDDQRWEATRYLGNALRARFQMSGSKEDIDRAVLLHQSNHDTHSRSGVGPTWMTSELGNTLRLRFSRFGDRIDLTNALALLQKSSLQTISDPFERGLLLEALAAAYFAQYLMQGEKGDLNITITIQDQNLSLCYPGHRDRPRALTAIGVSLLASSLKNDDMANLSHAIHHLETALNLQGCHHPFCIDIISPFGSALSYRYGRLKNVEDIKRAVALYRKALFICPPDYHSRPALLTNYAFVLLEHFYVSADLQDLDESTQIRRHCINLVPPGHPRRILVVNNLMDCLFMRFDYYANAADAEECVYLANELLDLCHSAGPDKGQYLSNVALSYEKRYELTGESSDLLEAYRLFRESVQCDEEEDIRRGYHLLNLARVGVTLHKLTKDVDYLMQAIDNYQEARLGASKFWRADVETLFGLSDALMHYHSISKRREDAEAAFQLCHEAIDSLKDQNFLRPIAYCKLSALYLASSPFQDVDVALDHLIYALEDNTWVSQARVSHVCSALATSPVYDNFSQKNSNQLLIICQQVIQLLPQAAFIGLDDRSRLRLLKETQALVGVAAYHAIIHGWTDEALEMLERGRAGFWFHYLRLRSDFEGVNHDLAQQLAAVTQQIQVGQRMMQAKQGSHSVSRADLEAFASKQRHLGVQLEKLLEEARARPGNESFLLPDMVHVLSHAANRHPVVVLLAGANECYAILISGKQVPMKVVALKLLSLNRINALVRLLLFSNHSDRSGTRDGRGMRKISKTPHHTTSEVLNELWEAVIVPIVYVLGLKKMKRDQKPRLHLCPTGPFSRLPLHAAGTFDQTGSVALADYAVLSYTPTIGILLNARRTLPRILKRDAKLLLAGVSNGFQWRPLPFAHEELRIIRTVVPKTSVIPLHNHGVAVNSHAEVQVSAREVLDKIPGAAILHLACHGYQNPRSPLESGFVMSDSMLTVEQLLGLELKHPLFAFLSACETAKGDSEQPDQAIHLAATMLFAGFKSVIGTMWSMGDVDGPIIAMTIYKTLFDGDEDGELDPEAIPRALDAAVQELRTYRMRPSRWAPYVHIGV